MSPVGVARGRLRSPALLGPVLAKFVPIRLSDHSFASSRALEQHQKWRATARSSKGRLERVSSVSRTGLDRARVGL